MSSKSLRKLMKSKTHRERGQLSSRKHLGLLEKRKDYKLRANKYKQNQEIIKKLREKAYFRNPDEYYNRMKKLSDRKDLRKGELPEVPEEEQKLLDTQSMTYLLMKHLEEKRRIDKLQQNLQLVNKKPVNNHIIFVDSEKEVKEFDPVAYFDTTPEGLQRTYNRPKLETLKKENIIVGADLTKEQDAMDEENAEESALAVIEQQRREQYQTLANRIKRQKAIEKTLKKVEVQQQLKGKGRKFKIEQEGKPPVYKWAQERKG